VPTIVEAGVPALEFSIWYGVWAPAGTPSEVISKLSTGIMQALASPELRDWINDHGAQPMAMTQPEFTRFVHSESMRAARIVKGGN
jgi:tripartite-type tricarboxylate transporter receptor subunit TctC